MKIIRLMSRWLNYVSAVTIILLMLLVVADVCGRYFFNNPIMGASELASFLMVIIVFPAFAWAALTGTHVRVDLVMERLRPRIQIIANIITLFISLGIYVIITWQSVVESSDIRDITSLLRIPHDPFYWIMTLAWAIFCMAILALLIESISKARKR